VPVRVTVDGASTPTLQLVRFDKTKRSVPFSFAFPARPVHVEVDPEFDLFRRIEREEMDRFKEGIRGMRTVEMP